MCGHQPPNALASPTTPAGAPGSRTTPGLPTPPFPVEEPYFARGEDQEGLNIREMVDIVLRGRWLILAAMLASVVPVTIWTYSKPSLYQSSALLLIDKKDDDLASVLPGDAGRFFFPQDRNLSNELLVLQQSLPLGELAGRRLLQESTPGQAPSVLAPGLDGRAPSVRDVALRIQSGYISAALQDRDADAVWVTAVSTVPGEAALIANVYADAYVTLSRDASREGISASRTFLEEQVAQKGEDLARLDEAVRAFMQREDAVALDEETTQLVNQLAQVEADRDAADVQVRMRQATISELQDEIARIEPRLAPRISSGVDREITQAQARMSELETQLEPYYRRNPEFRNMPDAEVPEGIVSIRTEIARLQDRTEVLSRQLAGDASVGGGGLGDTQSGFVRVNELRRQLVAAQVDLSGLRAQRDQLARRAGEYNGELSQIPDQYIDLAQLQRERTAAERLYASLDQKLQEARVAEEGELGYARVIRPAFTPVAPFAPRRGMSVLMALMFGFGAGVALAIARVRLDHRFFRPDDLREAGYPLLGTIPDFSDLIDKDFKGGDYVEVDGRRVDTRLISLLSPMATASESYRALRTSVQFSRPDTVVETILVTSASPGEGKSVTAANLALVLAQSGRRVLLVDCDLRRPTVHKKFGFTREPGLVQHVFDGNKIDPAVLHQPADDLWVMSAGTLIANPSELLSSRRMREVLDDMREQFDIVILDAPPVLAATDAVLLSTQADATLVVVRSGSTKDYDLDNALEALRGVGAKVIGTVLNGFDLGLAYGYKYKYAYRYGQDYRYYAYGHAGSESAKTWRERLPWAKKKERKTRRTDRTEA